jgi:AraC-like DNA-binding protein
VDEVVEPYRERPARIPGADLWTRMAEGGDYRVLPDGCMDLLIMDDELVVAGPDSHAWTGNAERGVRYAGIRFPPGTAPGFLGVPARELLNERVRLGDLWSPSRSRRLRDRIMSAPDRAAALDEEVAKVVDEPPDGLIKQVLRSIRAGTLRGRTGAGVMAEDELGGAGARAQVSGGGVRGWGRVGFRVGTGEAGVGTGEAGMARFAGSVGTGEAGMARLPGSVRTGEAGMARFAGSVRTGEAGVARSAGSVGTGEAGVARLAGSVGLSERQLHRRCLDAFGYGPKMLDRVLWMNVALDHARTGLALAEVAVLTGYADQAHFSRDVKALTGVPPRILLG